MFIFGALITSFIVIAVNFKVGCKRCCLWLCLAFLVTVQHLFFSTADMCANHRTFYLCTVVLIVRSLMSCFAMHWLFYTDQLIEVCVQSVMPAYWSLNNGRRELMASTSPPLPPPSPSPSTRSEICVQLLAAYSLLITLALSMTQQSFFKYLVTSFVHCIFPTK